MRRPLPPELVSLGDQLEAAASRALQRRRTRRQQVLNAAASLVVVLPIAASLVVTQVSSDGATPTPTPTPTAQPVTKVINNSGLRPARDDFPPREIRRMREAPNSALLLSQPSLRPALR